MTTPTVLSLFSGVGGFDIGFHAAGYRTTFMCEWDKHATAVLNRHFPDVPKWGDISTLTGRHILSVSEPPDVVIWGSPCQDLSVAGRRAGLDGSRSGLFYEGMRIINEIREATDGRYPRVSVWENVVGALNSNRGADFGCILDEMAAAGAVVIEWRVLDAQYFGVPQRRRRVFVVAVFDPATAERCPDPLLPVEEGVRGDTAEGATTREGVAGAVAAGVGGRNEDVVGSLAARDYKGVGNQYVDEGKVIVQPIVFENSRRDSARIATDGVTQTLSAHMGTGGGNTPMVAIGIQGTVIGRQDHNGPAGKGHTEEGDPMFTLTATDVHAVAFEAGALSRLSGRRYWNELSPTLKAHMGDNQPAVLEPNMTVRRLTPVECERLMGWPDDWTAGQADSHRYKQCGNGVASPVAEWIARRLRTVLDG